MRISSWLRGGAALILAGFAGACAVSLPSETDAGDMPGSEVSLARPTDVREALEAGDTHAFLLLLERRADAGEDDEIFSQAWLALDRASREDFAGARQRLGISGPEGFSESVGAFESWLDAWFLAMEGHSGAAIERHRLVSGSMPGITGELSLAAMLEASGRTGEALAVYEALTPARIEAPEHEFDPQGLVFNHVRIVITRHALLLHRLGRSQEAQAVYTRLAQAEPEQAVAHGEALESLATGRNLDVSELSVRAGFARSLSDVAAAFQQQRYIEAAMFGLDLRGLDTERVAFDLTSLLIDPENETIRLGLADTLYQAGCFRGAARVALDAPRPGPALEISAAQAFVMLGQPDLARSAVARALADATPGMRLQILYGALQITALTGDEAHALELLAEMLSLAEVTADQARANGIAASIYAHFGNLARALSHAEQARALDDTHERRLQLADIMARSGQAEEAVSLLRAERLSRPDDPYTLNALGYFLIRHTDRLEEGYRILANAMLMAGSDPYIGDSFGWALYLHGELDQARALIEAARGDLLPHLHWEIEDHLGDILWHQGQIQDARAAWQSALDQHPPRPERNVIEAKLSDGLSTPAPQRRPLPAIRIDDKTQRRQDI